MLNPHTKCSRMSSLLLQPPKIQPRTYILPVKTHKLTFFLTVSPNVTIASLKADVLSALNAPVLSTPAPFDALNPDTMDVDNSEWEVPQVSNEDDFELCRALKEKGRLTGKYERLEGRLMVKTTVVNWETLFVQFRDLEKGE